MTAAEIALALSDELLKFFGEENVFSEDSRFSRAVISCGECSVGGLYS